MAIALRRPPKDCIHYSDIGKFGAVNTARMTARKSCASMASKYPLSCMYPCTAGQWMSGKGNCYDNAAMETFFKTIKAELIRRHSWQTRRAVEIAIFEYINGFYNPRRRHSALGWESPLAFERIAA